jgi:4'-phosphopantetheinyl transferase
MLIELKRRENQIFVASVCFIDKSHFDKEEAINFMHSEERKYLDKLKYDKRIWSFLLGRISSKLALKELVEIPSFSSIQIKSGVFGFPVLHCKKVANFQTSITHTDNIAGAIVFPEEHPLSIDIERVEQSKLKAIKSVLTLDEEILLKSNSLHNSEGLTMLWSAKESLSKLLKTGMMLDFKFLEIDKIINENQSITLYFKNFGQYKAVCTTNPNYAIAIALPKFTTIHPEKIWDEFNQYNTF